MAAPGRLLVLLALGMVVPAASTASDASPTRVAALATAERASEGASLAFAPKSDSPPVAEPPLRVAEVMPVGDRVATDEPLLIRFERDVPWTDRAALVAFEPQVAGELSWPDARTVRLSPAHWRPGRPQRVKIALGSEAVEWTFRARVPIPEAIAQGRGARLVLSFDDGANDRRQPDRLLDRLRELGIRALFFPSGHWARKRQDWVERAVREGHRVCNHTLSHVNLTAPWMTEERVRSEIEHGTSDGSCRLFRPPLMGWDRRVERVAKELGYEVFLWDVDSRDWEGGPAEDVMASVLRGARPDAVVLFHIHALTTFRILPALAERLRAAGYVLSWDPADSPAADSELVGTGGRREWAELLGRPKDTAENPDDQQDNP